MVSTPVKPEVGIAACSDEFRRADGCARHAQRDASGAGGRRQQESSGQVEAKRLGVSRPRNHFAWANAVPTETENWPREEGWMREVHQ